MAQRVVKLKADPPPKGPAIRIYRDEDGFSFIVGTVNKDGVGDFRTESQHHSFEEAVKQAESRVAQFRLPLINDTGVELPTKAQPAAPRAPAPQTKAMPAANRKTAAQWEKDLDELPDPFASFGLPQLEDTGALKAYIEEGRSDLAHALFCTRRAIAIETHEQLHGDTRDHVVSYTQKTHDQIQTQIRQLYGQMLDERATVSAYLEAAFARIDQLERSAKGMAYRGVYRSDESYEPQDVVTFSGSAWICKEATTDKPGEGGAWQLMVKKGRDGKDVRA